MSDAERKPASFKEAVVDSLGEQFEELSAPEKHQAAVEFTFAWEKKTQSGDTVHITATMPVIASRDWLKQWDAKSIEGPMPPIQRLSYSVVQADGLPVRPVIITDSLQFDPEYDSALAEVLELDVPLLEALGTAAATGANSD